jgi:hypothetical protein
VLLLPNYPCCTMQASSHHLVSNVSHYKWIYCTVDVLFASILLPTHLYETFASWYTKTGYDAAFQLTANDAGKIMPPFIMVSKSALDMSLQNGEGAAGIW